MSVSQGMGGMLGRITADDNKVKGKKSKILLRLFSYMFKNPILLISALILTFVGNSLLLLGPKLTGLALDSISFGAGKVEFQKVYYYCLLMALTYTISALMGYILNLIMIKISQNVVFSIRKNAFEKLGKLPVGYFDTHQTGDIISRFSYDVETIGETLCQDFVQIATSLIGIIGSFVMMLTISPIMMSVFIITIPLSFFVAYTMSHKVRPLFRKRSAKLGMLNGFMEENISGIKTIKAYNSEKITTERFENKNDEAVTAHYNADYMASAVGPCVNFVNNISMGAIGIFGSFMFLFGKATIGDLSGFILYSRKFSGPINELANIISELQSSLSAAERIFYLLDEKEEKKDSVNSVELKNPNGDIAFENVTFGYSKNKKVINDLSFNAPKGSLIAIVGPTGAGKTTIINLLMRFYNADSGRITLDKMDINNIHLKDLRLSFAMVLQDTWLFKGTVFDNIAYGKQNATKEQVENAAKSANIHNFISSLPNGYDTLINEDGVNISQGQKQLITIARAMLLNANMLILDEATSNVDTITEIKIQNAMRRLMKDKTCFVIAHRLSTIKNADTILVIKDGVIAEHGRHDELISKDGVYAALYNSQF